MVPTSTIIACIFTLIISLFLPVLILLFFARKHKKQGIASAWLLGAAGFFVTQILIRIPILTVLSTQSWFVVFSQKHQFLYAFSLAFTAGLFELAGRWAVAKWLNKTEFTWNRALAAGLGHGSIEAMVIVGMTYINNLVYIVMINSGSFSSLFAGMPETVVAQLETIQTSLLTTSPLIFALAGIERLLTMLVHTAMSVIVCRGVSTGNTGKAVLICLGLHTLIDLTAGISLLIGATLTQAAAYTIIYLILTIVAVLSLWILKSIRGRWQEQEVSHVSEV